MSFFDKLAKWLDLDDFDKRDKTAFVVLGCAAVLILILWIWQLNRNIVNPLYGGLSRDQLSTTTNQTTQASTTDESLKNKDTDGDGLSDWDELNIYKTSPYLADTDGDGVSDFQEIKNGTDPNCPPGKDCSSSNISNTNTSADLSLQNQALNNLLDQSTTTGVTSTATITNTVTSGNTTNNSTQTNSSTSLTTDEKNALKQVIGSNKDPKTLREFLIASGADKNYVNALSDADLQKVINEILK